MRTATVYDIYRKADNKKVAAITPSDSGTIECGSLKCGEYYLVEHEEVKTMSEKESPLFNKLIDVVSYKRRNERELTDFEQKRYKYLAMKKTEFAMEFINASARYEMKKFELSAISITVILSILLGIWGNVLPVIARWAVSENDMLTITEMEREVAFIATILMLLLFVLAMLLIYCLKKQCYNSAREVHLMKEVKKLRDNALSTTYQCDSKRG